jgi:hypothetical protein
MAAALGVAGGDEQHEQAAAAAAAAVASAPPRQQHRHGRSLLEQEQQEEEDQQQQQQPARRGFFGRMFGRLFTGNNDNDNDNNPNAVLVPEQGSSAAFGGAPTSPLYNSPPPSFAATVTLDPSTNYGTIPQSFMGISHEWGFVEELAARPEYIDLVRKMGSYGNGPPIVRIGGGSTDKLTAVPEQKVWDGLNKLYREADVRYIVGLPFEKMNAPLAKAMYERARQELPSDAILSFEVGNEPNFYGGGNAYVRCCFIEDWRKFVPEVACVDPSKAVVDSAMGAEGSDLSTCELGAFAGPVWGHVNIRPLTLDWFLYSHGRWIDLATVHWYKATSQEFNTAETLMDEAPVRREMQNFRELVKIAAKHGKPLRVAEANTISNSGRDGVSNVFAAALWTLDASLEIAAAGGSGVNYHQGQGQNLYTGILRWTGPGDRLNPPIVKPPYYGYLAFAQAVSAGSRFIRVAQSSGVPELLKVFPLQESNGSGRVRVVLINKDGKRGGWVTVKVAAAAGAAGGGAAGGAAAVVTRMVAKGSDPLNVREADAITFGGVWLDIGGVPKGKATTEQVVKGGGAEGGGWRVYMPPGSAAIVELPPPR